MWPADIGADDGWRAGGCGRLSPPKLIPGPCLAIDGRVIPPSLKVLGQSNTVPRVCSSGLGQYMPLVGRAAGVRQQLLWVTAVEGPRVRQQEARVHIGVQPNTQIRSTGVSSCASTLTPRARWELNGADSVADAALGSELWFVSVCPLINSTLAPRPCGRLSEPCSQRS